MAPYEACDEGVGVRERIAYLFMISILILLIAVTFGVLGKGEYQPPKKDQGYVSQPWPEGGPQLKASAVLSQAQAGSPDDSGSRSTATS